MTEREIAFDVLLRVAGGSYADDALRAASTDLDARAAGLASELVFGVLRRQAQLDFAIAKASGKSGKLDVEVAIALRLGAYQICFLDRIPLHAAVSSSVDLVKRARKRSATGFANAVLRKVTPNPEWPDVATALSCPAWLLNRWSKKFGQAEAMGIAEAFLEKPQAYFLNGRQHDIGAQSIVPLLNIEPGESLLDMCAAPGNKSLQAQNLGATVTACDLHLHRLRQTPLDRRIVADARWPLPFAARFDKVLLDAPCSGTGTLGRNPEIKWRVTAHDLVALREGQRSMLVNGLELLRAGGRLVYSTCSLEPEENEDVVGAVCPDRVISSGYRLPGREPGDGFYHAVIA